MGIDQRGPRIRTGLYVPTEGVVTRGRVKVVVMALAFLAVAMFVLWIGYGQTGYGRPQAWVQFVAPINLAMALWFLTVGVRHFLIATGRMPLCAISTAPGPAIGGPAVTLLGLGWRELAEPTVITVACREFRTRRGRRVSALRLEVKGADGGKVAFGLSDVAVSFDWLEWTRDAFAFAPEVTVRADRWNYGQTVGEVELGP